MDTKKPDRSALWVIIAFFAFCVVVKVSNGSNQNDGSQTDKLSIPAGEPALPFGSQGDDGVGSDEIMEYYADDFDYYPGQEEFDQWYEEEGKYLDVLENVTEDSPPPAACFCNYNQYDCKDFDFWGEAQACFEYCLYLGKGDIHYLDDDDDFMACELLP